MCDAEDTTEIIEFKNKNEIYISAVELVDKYNIRHTNAFELKVKCDSVPKEIECIGTGKKVDFDYRDGYAIFTVEKFKIFVMYKISM